MLKSWKLKTNRQLLYKIYGLLLDEILKHHHFSIKRSKAKDKLHRSLKKAREIDSLTKLSDEDLSAYIDEIKAYFAIEMGLYLRSANEPPEVANISLTDYLKVMNHTHQHNIFKRLESLYDLESHKERKRFLCDLTGTPYTSTIGNEERLLEEIKTWLNFN